VVPLLADQQAPLRKPSWLKARLPGGGEYPAVRQVVDRHRLHTVCESAQCPNMGECWSRGTATLMILGDVCTRSCGFCAVKTGRPTELDLAEPGRVAEAIRLMGLKHVVITSVNRDELKDGGAGVWAETIRQTKAACPGTRIEVLIPDFCGNEEALARVLEARPDILNHNIETVPRLYREVRPQAIYVRSLELLARAKKAGFVTKSGLMLGLGETDTELEKTLLDLRQAEVDILTLGQYLQPSPDHLPVQAFVHPDKFLAWKRWGLEQGFKVVESGPMVRSSYHAEEQSERMAS
jgi:lipoic acid synthetase